MESEDDGSLVCTGNEATSSQTHISSNMRGEHFESDEQKLRGSPNKSVSSKQRVKSKIEQYFHRLTQGCHGVNCTNPNCASNPKQQKITGNEAAVKAIQLFQKKAYICKLEVETGVKNETPSTSAQHQVVTMDYNGNSSPEIPMDTTNIESSNILVPVYTASNVSNSLHCDMKDVPLICGANGIDLKSAEQKTEKKKVAVKEIKCLTEEMVADLLKKCYAEEDALKLASKSRKKQDMKDPYLPIVRLIGEVFSNMEGLNRSFVKQNIQMNCPELLAERAKVNSKETKMDVDHENSRNQGSETSSTLGQPFTSFLNSLMEGTGSIDSLLTSNSEGSSSNSSTMVTPQAGGNSSLHRQRAIKKRNLVSQTKNSKKSVVVLPPTVDIDAVRRVYGMLSGVEKVENALVNSLEILSLNANIQLNLMRQLHKNSKTLINLNMFITVMENPSLHSPEYLDKALPSFCKLLASLPLKAHVDLVNLWSSHDKGRLCKMVQTLQQLLTYKIVTLGLAEPESDNLELHKDETVISTVKCLKLLYYASLQGGDRVTRSKDIKDRKESPTNRIDAVSSLMVYDDFQEMDGLGSNSHWKDELSEKLGVSSNDCLKPVVPFEEFGNELLNSSFDVYNDFTQYMVESGSGNEQFTFMHFPFVLNTVNKTTYLFYDNRIRMLSGRRMMMLQSILNGSSLSPYLRLKIRRDHIIDDSLVRLEMIAEENPEDLRKQLYVEFDGEQGVDEGGVSKEFFQLVVEQIFNPDYGMFTFNKDTNLFWFNAHSLEAKAQFTLIGIVLGLAIYNNCILDVKFPPLVYKKLFGIKATFEDMKDSHQMLYNSLNQLLEYNGDVENDMMATFGVQYNDMFGITHCHELKANGQSTPVTNENRKEYVELYADWLLNEAIAEQFEAFHHGFELVVSQSPLKFMLRPNELEIIVSGSQEYDFKSLESTTDYDGGFDKHSVTVLDFWSVVHDMSDENKRKLLQFTTGTDRAPVGGLSQVKLIVARNGPDSDRLPTAHTCFNVILLPDYKNKEKLKERLHKAITYSKGFGML